MDRRERHPFVGRQHELAAFRSHLAAAQLGRGGVVFVAGEPGIGKTRLLLEIGRLARAEGWEVLNGRAYDSDGMPPYLPFVEALRSYAQRSSPDDLRAQLGDNAPEVARVVTEVRRRLPDVPASPQMGPELDRYRLFEGLTEFLLTIAQAAPGPGLLVVLDDLHWADQSSLQLVQHLAHRLAEARMLVAGSYRTVELNRAHPLATLLADLRREGISDRLLLPSLPVDDIRVLVESLAGARPTQGVLDLIARQTDGNPFFVRELTLHLQAEGSLDADFREPTDGALRTWSVPEGVREVIHRRLVRLGAPAQQMLREVAVLSGGFSFALLQRVSGIEDALLLDAVDEAIAAGILREEGDGYIFGHALIRETLYSDLSVVRRQRLHARAAEVLQTVYANALPQHVGDIAEHYRRAGPQSDPAKAVEFAVRAGEIAFGVFAYEQALAHWQSALQLMQEGATGLDQRISLLERLAELNRIVGFDHYPQAIGYWKAALDHCEANGLVERAAHAHCGLGVMLASNTPIADTPDVPAALAHLRAAQTTFEQQPASESLPVLYRGLSIVASWGARTQEGLAASQRELDHAARSNDAGLAAHAAVQLGWHLIAAGHLAEGLESMERGWETANRLDRTYEAYVATSWHGNRYFLLGDPGAAAECYKRELAKTRLIAAPSRRLALISSLAAVKARTGDLLEARQLITQRGQQTFDQDSAMLAPPLVAFWGGDWESAGAMWTAASERHRRGGNRWGVADFACWLGQLRYVQGNTPAAARAFEEALAIAVEAPIVPIEVNARTGLALLAASAGDQQEMWSHLQRCTRILAEGEDWRGLAGQVKLAEAVAMAAASAPEPANERFAEAIEIFRQYTLPWDEAQALHRWGRALADAGRTREADAKLHAAVDVYERHGAGAVWIERVLGDRPTVGSRAMRHERPAAARPATYPDGLSEREVQVVRLIAAGKSNREIAQALVISRNTVERHVNHILAKTGAANRTQVAGYAHRHSLITSCHGFVKIDVKTYVTHDRNEM